jgi:arylsulfatase A-like enzyme
VGLNLALIPGNPAGLDPRYPTLPEHLAAEGYRNYLVGK